MYNIGDHGYPLEPWMMTPLPHYPQWSRQYHYNEKLCKILLSNSDNTMFIGLFLVAILPFLNF